MPAMALELDTAESLADRIQDMVDRYQAATSAFTCSIGILPKLYSLRRDCNSLRRNISSLSIETDEDREFAKDASDRLMSLASKVENTQDKYARHIIPIWSWPKRLGETNISLFEQVYCSVEDAAETLSLGASMEFTNRIDRDLGAVHGRT